MNCIIIDDEATARTIINQLCLNTNGLSVVGEFSSAIQAIKYLNHNKVDLIFLDIHMPDFTGFDFIRTVKDPPKVIVTTGDINFAIEAFEYDCIIAFLVKPIVMPRFKKAIQKVVNIVSETAKKEISENVEGASGNILYVNIDRRLIKIDIPSIYLIEAKGDYIHVKTDDKNYLVHSTLKKIEEKLPDSLFLKVHRSFIINVTKIIDIEDNSVLIKRDVIPLSRSNRPELMKRLNLL